MILANDHIHIGVCPEQGGSLTHVRYRGHDIFQRAAASDGNQWNPMDTSCFPLVPFSNRIEHGRFTFYGHKAALSPNMGDHPHAIHGQGWLGKWTWAVKTDTACQMLFTHQAGEWPWSYTSRQNISLHPNGFRHEMSVMNKSRHPMPAGLGLHPQIVRTPACSLQAETGLVWLTAPDGIPTEQIQAPMEWSLPDGKCVSELHIDNCFGEWNRKARIEWPELGIALTLSADDLFDHLVVYVPDDESFFCVEPVSHMPNALNQTDPEAAGMVTLKPEQELTAGVTYLFEELQ